MAEIRIFWICSRAGNALFCMGFGYLSATGIFDSFSSFCVPKKAGFSLRLSGILTYGRNHDFFCNFSDFCCDFSDFNSGFSDFFLQFFKFFMDLYFLYFSSLWIYIDEYNSAKYKILYLILRIDNYGYVPAKLK